MKYPYQLLLAVLALTIGVTSCLDIESDPVFICDAFIVSRIIDGDTLYALDAQVQSSQAMKKVTMTGGDIETSISLYPISTDSSVYEYSAKDEQYKSTVPEADYYLFSVVLNNNSTYSLSDAVLAKSLKPFTIDSIYYYSNDMTMTFDWPVVTNASYYYARIIRNDTIVFDSGLISNEFTSMKLTSTSSGWYNSYKPGAGDSLVFSAMAIMKEDVIYNNYLEIQSLSFSDFMPFVWGE